jgi:hypothetical protein
VIGNPEVGAGAFEGVANLTRLELLGDELVDALLQSLATDTRVVGAELAGEWFGDFEIVEP